MKKIKKPISILLTVLMVFSVFAVVPFTASAAEDETTISNIDEWNTFVSSVNNGNTYEGKTVKLTADIENITEKINVGKEFNGTFDGQNHTLKVNLQYDTNARGAGLFPRVGNGKSITVKNLTLGGVIVGGIHTGGIVGEAANSNNQGGATITIENVNVVAYITQPGTHLGGFIGHPNSQSTVNINNCHFLGDLRSSSGEAECIGGIVGWRDGTTQVNISDSGFGGTVGDTKDFNAWVILFGDQNHTQLKTEGTLYTCKEAHYSSSSFSSRIGQYSPDHETCKQIAHTVKSEYTYDGNPHGLEISTTAPASGAIITYGTEEGKYLYANSPTLTEAGTKTVYYQIASPGYATVRGSAELTVKPSYTVTWKNWNGTVLETDKNVAAGTTPTYDGTPPTKPADGTYTYTFAGWKNGTTTYAANALPEVTGDATYTATFTFSPSLVGRYVETPGRGGSNTMVFPDCDVYITGVTGTQTIHNTSVTYSHSASGSYDVLYFNGQEIYRGDWAVPDGIRIVSGSGTSSDPYVTEWYSTPTITWKLDKDTVIDTTKVPFDVVPTHAAPTKEPDEEYTYTFAGWSPEPVAVTVDATYTATFTAVPRPYNVNVETAEHGTVTANPAEAAKGKQVTLTAEPNAGYALSSIKAFKKNTNSQQATLTALGGSSTGDEGYDKLVDGNTTTKWGFYGGSGYIIVKADKAFILNDYSLTTANDTTDYSGRNWKNWEIYGANFASDSEAVKNSDQWHLVTSVTNDSKLQATNFTRYDYSVNTDPEAYQYYKIEISANKGDGYTQMSELTLSGTNYDVEVVLMQDSADPATYTFEMPASNVTVKAEFEAIPTYTVTWKNWNGDELYVDPTVPAGVTPTYPYENPTRPEDDANTYTFSNWDPDVQPVTGPADYKATYTAVPKPKTLIAGHSLSLDGNIGINFYLDPSVAGLTAQQVNGDNLSYTFAWADVETTKAQVNVAEQAAQKKFRVSEDGKYIIITCHVCAAEMTCDVDATFTLNGKRESETYSVRKYCDTVLHPTEEWLNAYKAKYPDGTAKCYDNLEKLVEAMLNYGAMAQTKFKVNTGTPGSSDTPGTPGKLANEGVTYNPGEVTGDMLDTAIAKANGTGIVADNMNNVAAALGAKWFSTSLIYLDDSTLRHYFVKDTNAFNPSDYKANKSNYYYYVEKTGIPAADLDKLQSFTAGTQTFKYSALDFVKGMITSSADGDSVNLAKSLYWYNQAANAYFPDPAPAEKILVLDGVTEDTTVEDGYTITGTLQGDYKISIADGASVTLKDVDITCLTDNAEFAAITPLGDATIILEGRNTVKGGYNNPGIYVPKGKTLTIDGEGYLTASSAGYASSGIGGGNWISAGSIIINGGNITAKGGKKAAGIGGGTSTADNITINGGNITAIGGEYGAGIGCGYWRVSCGDITIKGGTITATGGEGGAGIGCGKEGTTCGKIIITGGTVNATGGEGGAGIGGGDDHTTCGDITIANTVTKVIATKGSGDPNSIGAGGYFSFCGTVTIEDGANVIQN